MELRCFLSCCDLSSAIMQAQLNVFHKGAGVNGDDVEEFVGYTDFASCMEVRCSFHQALLTFLTVGNCTLVTCCRSPFSIFKTRMSMSERSSELLTKNVSVKRLWYEHAEHWSPAKNRCISTPCPVRLQHVASFPERARMQRSRMQPPLWGHVLLTR